LCNYSFVAKPEILVYSLGKKFGSVANGGGFGV